MSFFFSSRRRHTRWPRDWSSDVCSSDLESRDEERREEDIAGGGYQEVALRLMTALATGRPERMILDVGNAPVGSDAPPAGRIIPELPADAVIEVLCLVDGDGVHPQPVAPVELDRLGMMAG